MLSFHPGDSSSTILLPESSKANVKDKIYHIQLLGEVINTLFRVSPIGMDARRFFSLIVKYVFHMDQHIPTNSTQLLTDLMKTRPAFRSLLVEEFVTFMLSMPDTDVSNLHHAATFLNELLLMWIDPTVLHRLDTDMDSFGSSDKHLLCPAYKLEAMGLILLCNRNSAIRADGFTILKTTQKLNESLPSDIAHPSPRVFMILKGNEQSILSSINKDSTLVAMENKIESEIKFYTLYQLLTSMRIDDKQLIICRCIGEVTKTISPNCREVLETAFDYAWRKLGRIPVHSSKKIQSAAAGNDGSSFDQIFMWRNYLTLILGAGTGKEQTIEPVFQRILPLVLSPHTLIRSSLHYAIQF